MSVYFTLRLPTISTYHADYAGKLTISQLGMDLATSPVDTDAAVHPMVLRFRTAVKGLVCQARHYVLATACVATLLAGSTPPAIADFVTTSSSTTTTTTTTTLDDPLHGYCSTGCIDNGTNSPTTQNPITGFGFTISPSDTPVTGDLVIDILTPNNDYKAGTKYSIYNELTTPPDQLAGTANLFSSTAWTTGSLADYLGIPTASPENPIGAFLPSTQTLDNGATGFDVYQADLSTFTLQPASNPNSSPLFDLTKDLPIGSYIVAFFQPTGTTDWIATANSGAIFAAPEIDAASGSAAIAFLLGVLALISERRRAPSPEAHRQLT